MAVQGSDIILAVKKQSGLGSAAAGSGATGITVRPAAGLARQVASIQSQVLRPSYMRKRPRQGSITAVGTYERELTADGAQDIVFGGVLGSTTNSFSISNTDVTDITISGTGTVATVTSGDLITLGLRNGLMGKFSGLSVTGNNGKWFPIRSVTATTFAIPTGFLADNTLDASFTLTIAKYFSSPNPRVVEYYSVEEYLGAQVDASKYGTDMKFDTLNIGAQPNQPWTVGFGVTGLGLQDMSGGSAPVFTSPTYPSPEGDSVVGLDGYLFLAGSATEAAAVTGLTLGLQSRATVTPLLFQRTGSDVMLSMFDFTGQVTAQILDDSFFAGSIAETNFDLMTIAFDESKTDFVSFYAGDVAYGQWGAPIADGQMIQTVPLYGGSDGSGSNAVDTTLLISVSQ